jgi:phospholipase/carboxylesterase
VLHTAPERVAGVVALSTHFGDPLVKAPADAAAVAGVPVFVAHGVADRLLPIANGRAIRDRLQPLLRDFTYREYPIGHTIVADEIRDVAAWLTARLDR